jgi:hypothetical protein
MVFNVEYIIIENDFVHKNTITCLVYVTAREGLQDSQCHRKQSYLFISKTHII